MAEHKNEEVIFDVEDAYSKSESWVIENQKSLTIIVGVGLLLVLSFFGYKYFIQEPNEAAAKEMVWMAEKAFAADSLEQALNGTNNYAGFLDVINSYGSTETGNLAHYYAGVAYLRLGEYNSAIDYLEDFDCTDELVCSVAMGATGDAYMEIGQVDDAIKYYKNAANHSANDLTTPIYLMKAAKAHEIAGDHSDALALYKRIKKEYPTSAEGATVDKYIARAEGMTAK
ncbi:MAG: tetratricopeptide repeat protein [Salibacteraceae bacterium]|nr:tetratricopeptide repeat protein [Salibacteraceae bacterium]MDP4685818.1 tetratricopeptide repeat protein [Salibacteraceae bacterium]MDP4763995.1 tetratricopeptide repeat protein [Salibacteraceae bacterium]MDP4843753.1 tetratricopeptide repeat protein [Salibacteraceae bacterium]MDP4964138.1 tetratricopeptide repeat protein [Salibacteraceae bacterium]